MLALVRAQDVALSRELRALLLVAAIFVVGAGVYRLLFVKEAGERFQIVNVSGDVRHVDSDGESDLAKQGDRLEAGDRIVSGDGGRAILGLGENTRVAVDASTSVRVLGVNAEGVRLDLEGGRVQATVRPGGGRVGVVAGDREIVADDADFTAVVDEEGTFGVTSERGSLALLGVAGMSQLRSGDEVVIPKGGTPLSAPASEALLLQVVWPAPPRTRERDVELTGNTQPGAKVAVIGGTKPISVKAGPDGTFRVMVPLAEGQNRLAVVATSVMGKEAKVDAELVRDTQAPSVGVTLEF